MRMFLCGILVVLSSCASRQGMFKNPLLPSGADPWSIYKDGYYYYTHTVGDRITIWKTKNLADLASAESKTIFDPPPGTEYSEQLWAPEIHYINSKWYVYFAADDGDNNNHRMYLIENSSADPFSGNWEFRGKVKLPEDKWAIDGSVFAHNNQLYMVWSGWQGNVNRQQDIYICKMKDPLTPDGPRVRISSPTFDWERHGDLNDAVNPPHVAVNEGPQFIANRNKLFIIYSASGCWTDNYGLGLLVSSDTSNLLDSSAWKKHERPIFNTSKKNRVYAPGHNSFFLSPDSTETWILYHANDKPGLGCGRLRSPRAQKFLWTEDGMPQFGEPVKTKKWINVPSDKLQRKNSSIE